MQWQKKANILAFPHHWQRPAKTEEWAYQRCLSDLTENHFMQVVCFPWATLIDLQHNQKNAKAQVLLDALKNTPPRITLIRATVCQHIYMKDMLPIYKQLKITDVFWSHAVTSEHVIDGIRIHPFPLYPVQCENLIKNKLTTLKPLNQRKYLYSFIGAYDPDLYLTPVRQWLFNLPKRKDAQIEQRYEWHYEKQVYNEQMSNIMINNNQLEQYHKNSLHYKELMQETVFCLCPSGSGPNSIRLWEALGFGCVPVVLADTLQLPGDAQLWNAATVKMPEIEDKVKLLPEILQNFKTKDIEKPMTRLWQRYGIDSFIYDIQNLPISQLAGV